MYAPTLGEEDLGKLTNDGVIPDENGLPTDLFTPTFRLEPYQAPMVVSGCSSQWLAGAKQVSPSEYKV